MGKRKTLRGQEKASVLACDPSARLRKLAGLAVISRILHGANAKQIRPSRADCEILHMHASSLSAEIIQKKKLDKKPILVVGGAVFWVNGSDWSPETFIANHGELVMPLRDPDLMPYRGSYTPIVQQMRVDEYVRSINDFKVPIFENKHNSLARALRTDLDPQKTVFPRVRRTPIVSLGGEQSGISLHSHEENWLAQLTGRKMWFLHKPWKSQQKRPETREDPCSYSEEKLKGAQQCTAHPGDLLYVPALWWHATCNLDSWTLGYGGQGHLNESWPAELIAVMDGSVSSLRQVAAASDHDLTWADRNPYSVAGANGFVDVLDELFKMGVSMELPDAEQPPLMQAVATDQLSAVKWLVAHGVSVDIQDDNAATPLMYACLFGHEEIARWLLETAHANTGIIDKMGRSALHWCASNGSENIVRLWVEGQYGGLKVRDNEGKTPTNLAQQRGEEGTWQILRAAEKKASKPKKKTAEKRASKPKKKAEKKAAGEL